MKLQEYNFPEITGLDMAFSTIKTDKGLLEEARARGFYNGHTKYNDLFSNLFFNGGKVKLKENIDRDFQAKAWRYCRALMGSFEPKHEEKEAICAMIMSEVLEA